MGKAARNGTQGRARNGRFAEGNPGGPGRPPRQTEREYLRAMMAACTVDDWREIVGKAVDDAKQGEPKAREWLARYLVGAPVTMAPRQFELAAEDEVEHDPIRRDAEHLARFGEHLPMALR
jgi:hypothetical protein